jgi:ribosomal protein S18 acetylase RimI-like enzyme
MGEHATPGQVSALQGGLVLELRSYDASSYDEALPAITAIYRDVYSEPPYNEGPEDVNDFRASMSRRARQPAFILAVASLNNAPVGFAFGHQLTPDTKWWEGAEQPLPGRLTSERQGRTFAVIELAVLGAFRRKGIARTLHDFLLSDRTEERSTLLVRPEAKAANAAYASWGYTAVSSLRPWTTAPLYTAMVMPLHTEKRN